VEGVALLAPPVRNIPENLFLASGREGLMSTQLSEKDISTIRWLTDEWVRLCLKQEWDEWKELLAQDIVFLPPDQRLVEGKKAVRGWIEDFPIMKEFTSTVVQVKGRDDFAWARGIFTMTVESESGAPMSMKGKWSSHYRKQPDGSWLYGSLTWNLDEPPTAV
jgi:ketosteroid isomerase-like protein